MNEKPWFYLHYFIMWCIGGLLGFLALPDNPAVGMFMGGNTIITCLTYLELFDMKNKQ